MGGGKAGGKFEVTDYRMSIHYGVGLGPLDALLGIYVGEKEAWSGVQTGEGAITINNPNLFGGMKKEGGVVGTAYYLSGQPMQTMPDGLAGRFGLTGATCPAFRGLSTVFFVGDLGGSFTYSGVGSGFLWGSNNPYLRDIWFRARRAPKGLAAEFRTIDSGDGRKNANPAAIIYECLVNPEFAMGGPDANINLASFEACATVLRDDEVFGLSLQWTRQEKIENFVSEILDHIQATLFVNPRDGLWTLKLIRGDYEVEDLPILDDSNCIITNFERKGFGETISEIVVTWTNPENEQEETVTAQDLALISIQGAPVSDGRNYYGVRNSELATMLANRDLASASAPLAVLELEVDRSAWDFVPGGCAVLNNEEYGIEGLVIRLGKIDYGKKGQPEIRVAAVEDIFSLPVSAYTVPAGTQWVDPSADPEALDPVRIITAPSYFTLAAVSFDDAEAVEYPNVYAAILAGPANADTASYDVVQQTLLPNGDYVGDLTATKPALGTAVLQADLDAEATSTVASFGTVLGATGPVIAGFVVIGATTEDFQEIALIAAIDSDTGAITLKRGVLDTVPRAWAEDTPVWFLGRTTDFIDRSVVRAATEVVRYKLLARTSLGTLAASDAPIVGTTLGGRPHLPNRPGNVTVAGAAFGSADVSSSPPSTIPVTWANRNRLLEDNLVLAWGDATMTPEAGQTTKVTVHKTDGTTLATHSGLTGTSYDVPLTDFGAEQVGEVRVLAERDGFTSLQYHAVRVRVAGSGGVPPGDPPPGGGGDDPDPGGDFRDWERRLSDGSYY